jgi:hypothetical protein
MDSKRFDSIVKSIGTDASRRQILKGLAGSVLGAGLVSRVATPAQAAQVTTCDDEPYTGGRCRNDGKCNDEASNPCCIGLCAKGNAGEGGGNSVCTYVVKRCNGNKVPVARGGRCRCRPASSA